MLDRIEKYRPHILYFGIVSAIIPILVYSFGCIMSDGYCSGDSMGGIMMVYALSIFVPNFGILLCSTVINIFTLVKFFKVASSKQLVLYGIFFGLVTMNVFLDRSMNWFWGKIFGLNHESTIDTNKSHPKVYVLPKK